MNIMNYDNFDKLMQAADRVLAATCAILATFFCFFNAVRCLVYENYFVGCVFVLGTLIGTLSVCCLHGQRKREREARHERIANVSDK